MLTSTWRTCGPGNVRSAPGPLARAISGPPLTSMESAISATLLIRPAAPPGGRQPLPRGPSSASCACPTTDPNQGHAAHPGLRRCLASGATGTHRQMVRQTHSGRRRQLLGRLWHGAWRPRRAAPRFRHCRPARAGAASAVPDTAWCPPWLPGPASELACRSLQARTFRRTSPARPLLSHAAPRRGSPPLPLPRSKLPPAALARRDAPRGDRAVIPRDSGSADAASGLLLRVEDGAGLDASGMGNARGPDGPCA